MSRKRLSIRRQNEIASRPDPDLPIIDLSNLNTQVSLPKYYRPDNPELPHAFVCEAGPSSIHHNEEMHSESEKEQSHQEKTHSGSDQEEFNLSCSSSEYSNEDEDDQEEILRENLKKIAIDDNMNISTLTKILHALNPLHPDLPLDGRTLLGTPVQHNIRTMGIGQYCHFGFEAGLSAIEHLLTDTLHLLFNIDGLPLTKGNQQHLWPILCKLTNINHSVFPVGIYEGPKKPESFNEYMSEFISELGEIVKNGIIVKGKLYTVCIDGFIMDAPATASVLHVTPFNSYHGCRKCCVHGKFLTKVIFTDRKSPLRTDSSFRERSCPEHHTGKSILENLPLNMVVQFPNDPMHLVHLGVMKKIVWLLLDRKKGGLAKLPKTSIELIDKLLEKCRKYFPREFQRKPRSILHYSSWKATEFRDFLLYTGPFVLKNHVPAPTYKHFMALSTAIRILSSNQYLQLNQQADELLQYFVEHFPTVYGKQHMTYNVHNLLHLASDSKHFGELESFSAYPFESFLGKLKQKRRSAYKPLHQISNRIIEMRNVKSKKDSKLQDIKVKLSKKQKHTDKYHRATFSSFCITARQKGEDCVFLTNNIAIKVVAFLDEHLFEGAEVINIKEFYDKPTSLKKLHNIFTGSFDSKIQTFKINDIWKKFVYFPINDDDYFFTPLIHTASQ